MRHRWKDTNLKTLIERGEISPLGYIGKPALAGYYPYLKKGVAGVPPKYYVPKKMSSDHEWAMTVLEWGRFVDTFVEVLIEQLVNTGANYRMGYGLGDLQIRKYRISPSKVNRERVNKTKLKTEGYYPMIFWRRPPKVPYGRAYKFLLSAQTQMMIRSTWIDDRSIIFRFSDFINNSRT